MDRAEIAAKFPAQHGAETAPTKILKTTPCKVAGGPVVAGLAAKTV
jgi:hypothetical protein